MVAHRDDTRAADDTRASKRKLAIATVPPAATYRIHIEALLALQYRAIASLEIYSQVVTRCERCENPRN